MLVTRSRSNGTTTRTRRRSSSLTTEPRACSCSPCPARAPARRSAIPSDTRRECQRSRHPTRAFLPDGAAAALAPGSGPAATFATTEHFNLQVSRAITVSEANGRASIYLAALSSNLIALAFIGQMSRLGVAFYAFALILLPVLAFVGTVTFLRLVQSSIEDIAYAHRIARAQLLPAVSPELEPFIVVLRGRRGAPLHGAPGAWQPALTAAGMIAVVNSVVVTACAGLVLVAVGVHSLAIPVAAGSLVGAAAFALHRRHRRRARDSSDAVDRAAILIPPPQPADAA